MFVGRAWQNMDSNGDPNADRFVDPHTWVPAPGVAQLQQVLDDHAAWNPAVIPYIHDLPAHGRAILLDTADSSELWAGMETQAEPPAPRETSLPAMQEFDADWFDHWLQSTLDESGIQPDDGQNFMQVSMFLLGNTLDSAARGSSTSETTRRPRPTTTDWPPPAPARAAASLPYRLELADRASAP